MSFYDRLITETVAERERFLATPLIMQTLQHGAPREIYLAFLAEAYHHVKHTFPLLALAASRTDDERYQDALVEYMEEERGHEKWILQDIHTFGGNPDAVRLGKPGQACQIMVGYAYYAIEHVSPYAMLGSVHVLEGMSVLLADKVADAVRQAMGVRHDLGFSYLRSHGSLDMEHVAFFKSLADSIHDAAAQAQIIESARIFYRLYGAIFDDLGRIQAGARHAA